jgi:hypothetical protein
MPDSYPFPMYSGLLEPEHYKKIGSAIWLFLWCVSSTTKDVEREGVAWGIVLGNKPIKREELAEQFGVAERTVQRWIDTLEQQQYIKITRAPYGMIFSVKNSKKFSVSADKNVHSLDEQSGQICPVSSDRVDINVQSLPERVDKSVQSNKDITKDLVVVVDEVEMIQSIQEIENHFLKRRAKGFAVSPNDYLEIKQLVAAGVPSPLIKTCIDRAFSEYRPRHSRDEIRSFNFIVPRILDEYEREKSKAITDAVPHVAVALGSGNQPGYKSKQQRELDELEQLREEELKREQASGH